MPDPAPTPSPPAYKDRKIGLVVFGVVLLLIGAVCALLAAAGFLGAVLNQPGYNWKMSIGSAALYVTFAASFVWLGIGSILARRWARTLILMLAWAWWITGILNAAVLAFLLPTMTKWMMLGGEFGSDVERVYPIVLAVALILTVALLVVLPGVLILFYRSSHVLATVEARDPRLSWTERRPRPVVLLSVAHAVLAYFLVLNGFMYGWTVPLFGVVAGGWAGALVVLASTGASVYLTAALYERGPSAWWIATGLAAAWTVSAVTTFLRVPIADYGEAIGMPPESLQVLAAMGDLTWATISSILAISVPYFAYLVYAKRFYRAKSAR